MQRAPRRITAVGTGALNLQGGRMDWRDRIVSNPDILVGKPSVKGTRLSVELVLGWLASGWTHEMILDAYPQLAREDILALLAFAADLMRNQDCVAIRKSNA
jgi:uncharacterized protein (DUF433 family)